MFFFKRLLCFVFKEMTAVGETERSFPRRSSCRRVKRGRSLGDFLCPEAFGVVR